MPNSFILLNIAQMPLVSNEIPIVSCLNTGDINSYQLEYC